MEYNFENTMACTLQSWDWLENRRSEDNEVSRGVWKAVKAKAVETRVVKTKERREEIREEEIEEERKKRKKLKDNEDKEGSREMGNLGWKRGSDKVRRRGKKAGVRMFSSVDSYLWEEIE